MICRGLVWVGSMMTSLNWNIFRITGPFVRGIHRSLVYPKSPLYFPIVISSFYYSTSNYYIYSKRIYQFYTTLLWRLNDRDGVSNHMRLECLLFRRR